MISRFSRRSFVRSGIAAVGLTAIAGPAIFAQATENSSAWTGEWTSTLYGDEVRWDESHMWIEDRLSGPRKSGEFEWDVLVLSLHEQLSTGLVKVVCQERDFADLDSLPADYPATYWGDAVRAKYHPRDPVLSADAYGFFYTEDDTQGTGAHYCGYHELKPPDRPDGIWTILQVETNVNYHEFDLEILSANLGFVEINGRPMFQAWTREDVIAAFAQEAAIARS